MNAKDLAKAIGVHHNTIYNMIKSGELKAEKKNRTYEVDDEQAQKLILAKRIVNSESNISSGADDVLNLLKENKRQAFLKVIDHVQKLQSEINNAVGPDKNINDISIRDKLFEISKDSTYLNLVHFIRGFEEIDDMSWKIEKMKENSDYDNYNSSNVNRLKKKFKELDAANVHYSVEDKCSIASNSLTFLD